MSTTNTLYISIGYAHSEPAGICSVYSIGDQRLETLTQALVVPYITLLNRLISLGLCLLTSGSYSVYCIHTNKELEICQM